MIDLGKEDPLDQLFVKDDEINRERLRSLLIDYIRLDEKGNIFPLTAFFHQTNKSKLIILLLARKALALKSGREEAISPLGISKLCNLPEGSIRPSLRFLVEEGIADDEGSKYKVMSHALPRCAELLETKSLQEGREKMVKLKSEASKISMKAAIEELISRGSLDDGKSVREILDLVLRVRPGTEYRVLYKVILDLVNEQKLSREIKGETWLYKGARK